MSDQTKGKNMPTPLNYLKEQLNFKAVEWMALTDEDRATLRRWAEEEMRALGITSA